MESPSPRQILILTHEFSPTRGGIATYVEEMARAAALQSLKVDVWAPFGAPARQEQPEPFTLRRFGLRGNQNWPDRLRLWRELRRAPRDWSNTCLYLPEPGPIRLWLYANLFALPKPARLVLTFHGSELRYLSSLPHRRERLIELCRRADRIGVVSAFVRRMLEDIVPGIAHKTIEVPGAASSRLTDLAASFRAHQAPEASSPRLDRSFNLLSVARVHPRKGLNLAVEAIAQLPPDLRQRVRYTIVGPARDPGFTRKLLSRARKLNVILTLAGTLDSRQLGNAYARSDLLLFTSRDLSTSVEGLGLSILEAAAFGVPAIATRTGGTIEAIVHNETGILTEPENAGAIALAIEYCLRNDGLRKQLGETASRFSATHFSWNKNASLLFQ